MTEFTIYNLDVFVALKEMQQTKALVDCVITSPPYWGLRDYGVEGQIGLEEHPRQYIEKMVKVFSEVRKVMKPTASLWINLGDTYFAKRSKDSSTDEYYGPGRESGHPKEMKTDGSGWLQPKQRLLIPHRVAIAMQDDGWILRNDIVWHKPSHMPCSVSDRLTNSFEYVFHFVKQRKYYYDLDAIREPHQEYKLPEKKFELFDHPSKGGGKNGIGGMKFLNSGSGRHAQAEKNNPFGKNPADVWKSWGGSEKGEYFGEGKKDYEEARVQNASDLKRRVLKSYNKLGTHPSDFWSLTNEPFSEAHFACFPTKLVRKPLMATCPQQICSKCGKPKERIYKTINPAGTGKRNVGGRTDGYTTNLPEKWWADKKFVGWSDCNCNAPFVAGTVLDPFVGSGTTLLEAQNQGKNGIGIELNPKYIPLIKLRLNGDKHQESLNKQKITIIPS